MNWQSLIRRQAKASATLLLAGLVFAGAAVAHVFPQKQEPGAGATVASPAAVKITFDGPLEPAFSSLTVTDAAGKQMNTAKAAVDAHDPAVMTVPLPALSAGHYTVHWVAVASDGHRTHGDYAFDVK
ncbi:copper resistance protein CopC [Caballeronia choica]|jgi:methionine-rich copper-binding protein CopC|uniref:Copper resistance protein CopC n=1 Tax=Caballeronia choica TaxID=326476 RepID=A0A158K0M2_9BURK|nr:copper resistance protein CopC [Caballeronia choica]SAL74744.1 copper resistance protein CopC [Caballeronia choica]